MHQIPENDRYEFEEVFLSRHVSEPAPMQSLAIAIFVDAANCLRRDPMSEDYIDTWRWATRPNENFDMWANVLRTDPDLLRERFKKLTPAYMKRNIQTFFRRQHHGYKGEVTAA